MSAIATAAPLITAGSQIYGGILSRRIADEEGRMIRDQISLVRAEASAEAARYVAAAEAKTQRNAASSRLAYLKSGVQLSGSPLEVIDENIRVSRMNISMTESDIKAKAEAKAGLLRHEAFKVEAGGRASFIEGLQKASSTLLREAGRKSVLEALERNAGSGGPTSASPTTPAPMSPTTFSLNNMGFGSQGRLDLAGGF